MSKVLAAILGQSNEAGPGPVNVIPRTAFGAPCVDPIAPQGDYNTWWPRTVDLVARRGVYLDIYNAARGSTNLCDVWVGRCRTYAVSMVVAHGSYVLDGGNVYKAVGAIGSVYVLNVAPSSGVGTSGLTSWTNLGAAAAGDTNGAIYTEGSARFDPNGLLAAIVTGTQSRPGYDAKLLLISIGQTDKTLSSTRAQYGAALIAATNYFLARGYRVGIGFTIYGATSGLDAWYSSDLLPGRTDALAYFASNPSVFAGANLREALGVLTVSPTSGIGLQADQLHGNQACMFAAADYWDAALQAAGF
jgi:hypothetical protein